MTKESVFPGFYYTSFSFFYSCQQVLKNMFTILEFATIL
jgi:hypothetical protein